MRKASHAAVFKPSATDYQLCLPRLPRLPHEIHDSESAAYFTRVGIKYRTGVQRKACFTGEL